MSINYRNTIKLQHKVFTNEIFLSLPLSKSLSDKENIPQLSSKQKKLAQDSGSNLKAVSCLAQKPNLLIQV